MRLVVDSLIALLLVAVLVGVLFHYLSEQTKLDNYQQVHRALGDLYEQAVIHGSEDDNQTETGFPLVMKKVWFEPVPLNPMLDTKHPWLDIAPPGDRSNHPPDPVVYKDEQAGFWYNPNRGIFRARIKLQFTNKDTLRLYNQLNNCTLKALPEDHNPERKPLTLASLNALLNNIYDTDPGVAVAPVSTSNKPATKNPGAKTINVKHTPKSKDKDIFGHPIVSPAPRRQTLNDIRTNRKRR